VTRLLVVAVLLSLSGTASIAQAAGVIAGASVAAAPGPGSPAAIPATTAALPVAEPANGAEPPGATAPINPPPSAPLTHDMQVLLQQMTLVQLVSEQDGYARTLCAGNGLANVRPSPFGPMVLIPNAGDLSAGGSNVSIKLMPDGQLFFIPRVQGQRIRVPMNVGDQLAGQEVLSLTFDEGMQLMAAGQLVWTANNQGPYGDGRGLPGHIAMCDPWFDPNRVNPDKNDNSDNDAP
jgi:hypothetical protein